MSEKNRNDRLRELGGSDYEMRDGEPDIRGWDVKDSSGRHVGEVEDLLFDPASQKVRYLIVDLEDNDLELDDRKVLVPVGQAQLHEVDDDVVLPYASAEQLAALPEYDKHNLTEEHEYGVRHALTGTGTTAAAGATLRVPTEEERDFYNHVHFDEDHLYRNRNNARGGTGNESTHLLRGDLQAGNSGVQSGRLRLRPQLREEDDSKNISLREEKLNIERIPVNREAGERDLREQNIEMRERSEVPVVNKDKSIVEGASLRKDVNERDETIRDTGRNTEIDINRDRNQNKPTDPLTDPGLNDRP
jgi:sporulation protein YlmC with PRC-barrel domain